MSSLSHKPYFVGWKKREPLSERMGVLCGSAWETISFFVASSFPGFPRYLQSPSTSSSSVDLRDLYTEILLRFFPAIKRLGAQPHKVGNGAGHEP